MNAPPERAGPVRILLIDDDEDDFTLTRDLLADVPGDGYALDWEPDYDAALDAICKGGHDVYLLDYRLGERTGLDLLRDARKRGCPAPVIFLTGLGESAVDREAMTAGASDYLEKSRLDATILERSIRYTLQQRRVEASLEDKVRERTAELVRLNSALETEVAERRRAELALREEHRKKDAFLSTLAHELRNPLAPIRNALEIMRLAGNNPKALDSARAMMERQVAILVRLIEDLLDVARITQNKLRLNPETIRVRDVVDQALEISRPLIEKARLTLEVSAPAAAVRLVGDRVRLAQVLANLLNNAAKYTDPGGGVKLTAEEEGGDVVFRVRDTGIGIPPDVLPRIFELFTQIEQVTARAQGGLGIGLALVRQFTQMHGGRVEAHSEGPGKGSEFVVRVPIRTEWPAA
jgi:signal transduction histidine kinase